MKKYREDIKTIFEVLTFIIIFMSFGVIRNPVFSQVLLLVCFFWWAYNLYLKIQYRKGKGDYLLFPTVNDSHHKITSIVLGLVTFFAVLLAFYLFGLSGIHMVNGFCIVVLLVLNGIFDVPKGSIKIEARLLSITGLKSEMDQRLIKSIEIHSDRIVITDIDGIPTRLFNFNIDVKSADLIDNYIAIKKTNPELVVHNHVK
jgi:hypothetical protein